MSDTGIDFAKLKNPFPPGDVEWRIAQAGSSGKGIWAKCLAYITNRAIMQRLDDACGPQNWCNQFKDAPGGGVLCGISVRIGAEWVTKWDGAEQTDIEAVKGGLSSAMKRAAVQWGIGRYLYDLEEGWARVHDNGAHYARLPKEKGGDAFKWDPPELPAWALPAGAASTPKGKPEQKPAPKGDAETLAEEMDKQAAAARNDPKPDVPPLPGTPEEQKEFNWLWDRIGEAKTMDELESLKARCGNVAASLKGRLLVRFNGQKGRIQKGGKR